MTPQAVKAARKALGLTQEGLAKELRLEGNNRRQTIRRWEQGKTKITGPASVAIEYMLGLREPLKKPGGR